MKNVHVNYAILLFFTTPLPLDRTGNTIISSNLEYKTQCTVHMQQLP